MNILNRLEFKDGVVVYYFNDDTKNHLLNTNPLVFSLTYDKYITAISDLTYKQWLSTIKKVEDEEILENHITINAIGVREEIIEFAVVMEEEMRKKDKKYNETHRSDVKFLIEHLKEERNEVDHELLNISNLRMYVDDNINNSAFDNNKISTKVELVHEAIMCMLVRGVILEKLPHCDMCSGNHWIGQLCDGEGKRL